MAELSLRAKIAKFLCTDLDSEDYFADAQTKHTYWVAADSILKLMLAKVDKARLISIDRDVQTAYDVQLQAIKSLLEGK